MNIKFDSVSPIALILSGQTELWKNRLLLEKCEAIRQRIDIQSVLNHYDRSRTGEYIRHQLSYARAGSDIFTEKAVDSIFDYSAGVARVIDKVCTNVLIYGCQNRLRLIDDHAVKLVLECEFSWPESVGSDQLPAVFPAIRTQKSPSISGQSSPAVTLHDGRNGSRS